MKAALLGLLVVLVGNILAISFYSIKVASIVSSLAYFILLVYLIKVLKKLHPISTSSLFIFKLKDFKELKNTILNYKK